MVLTVLALCPCTPAMATPASEGAHACCAGKAGLNVAPAAPSCCWEDAQDTQPADPPVSVALVAGWATFDAVTVAAPAPPALPAASDFSPPSAAPLILRT